MCAKNVRIFDIARNPGVENVANAEVKQYLCRSTRINAILGMALLSAAIAVPLRLTSRRLTRAHDGIAAVVGVSTFLLGCYIAYPTSDGLVG